MLDEVMLHQRSIQPLSQADEHHREDLEGKLFISALHVL